MLEIYNKEQVLAQKDAFQAFFRHPKRKYEISDEYDLSRAETELLLEILTNEDWLRNTTAGWQWREINEGV